MGELERRLREERGSLKYMLDNGGRIITLSASSVVGKQLLSLGVIPACIL